MKNWEVRERKKIREFERERQRSEERKTEEKKEARRLREFLEDYDDERDDPKYYKYDFLGRLFINAVTNAFSLVDHSKKFEEYICALSVRNALKTHSGNNYHSEIN